MSGHKVPPSDEVRDEIGVRWLRGNYDGQGKSGVQETRDTQAMMVFVGVYAAVLLGIAIGLAFVVL